MILTKIQKSQLYDSIALRLYWALPFSCSEWWVPMWLVKRINEKIAKVAGEILQVIIVRLED